MKQNYNKNTKLEMDVFSFASKRKEPVKMIRPHPPDTNQKTVKSLSSDSKRNLTKIQILLLSSGFLLFMLAVTVLTKPGDMDISIPFFSSESKSTSDTNVTIGPLISSMDSGEVVKLSLDIKCAKKSYQKQITDLDTVIRNQIIWALQNQEAEKLITEGDYYALRTYIGNSVMDLIPKGMVEEIYMSELLRY